MGAFDITNPRYNKQISPVPWHFIKSRFHCTQFGGSCYCQNFDKICDTAILSQRQILLVPPHGRGLKLVLRKRFSPVQSRFARN